MAVIFLGFVSETQSLNGRKLQGTMQVCELVANFFGDAAEDAVCAGEWLRAGDPGLGLFEQGVASDDRQRWENLLGGGRQQLVDFFEGVCVHRVYSVVQDRRKGAAALFLQSGGSVRGLPGDRRHRNGCGCAGDDGESNLDEQATAGM